MTGVEHPVIRTPDQRIRVFVSSTLRELAEERDAARSAIERLRLAPVMFELGARPHPPRDLYRSYLAQSDVFIGIYGASYGWIAPDEDVSGLEDEYNLAPAGMPKLIYVKDADTRDPRLQDLIARIQADDTAAYLHFHTAHDLEDQIAGDLAMLLAERFDQSRRTEPATAAEISLAARVPEPYTETIGREGELAEIRALLAGGMHRVVSLIGPGGIGKSRLAIEAAHANVGLFPDGVYFVPLEGVLEPGLLLPTIAYILGVRDTGAATLEERIAQAIGDRHVLIVLDNFEQIVDEAPVLVRLYTLAPRACFLVTSRVVLRIRGERVFDVESLATPSPDAPPTLAQAQSSSACVLFAERAASALPGFRLTAENAADVIGICQRLDGLPLAIELAAAKIRLLTPHDVAERLGRSLPLLSTSVRDLPERHRTMRSTIDWSVSLLSAEQRAMLEDLGVFAARFSLDAVESVGEGRSWGSQAIETLAALIDASLVQRVESGGRSVFSLLAIVREYAIETLEARDAADAMRIAHADYYLALVHRIAPRLRGSQQIDAVAELGLEVPNLRATARHLVQQGRLDDAGDFAWTLFVYWWISGYFADVRLWMMELLEKRMPITTRTRAIATFFRLWAELWQRPSDQVGEGLAEAVRLFRESEDEHAAAMALAARASTRLQFPDLDEEAFLAEIGEAIRALHAFGDAWGESLCEVVLGQLGMLRRDVPAALEHLGRAVSIADDADDAFTRVVAGNNRARLRFVLGETDAAEEEFLLTLLLSVRLHFVDGATYGLEGMSAIAASHGEAWRAGALAAVAAMIRETTGIYDIEGFAVHLAPLEALRAVDAESVGAGERAGREMGLAEAIAIALPEAGADVRERVPSW
ncbi:ATP-binding protein [Microbacterium ureisolvens]|uniref:ATP-binding protein n=1 Tax=Microbacterium ureisolvens TaxID=2781186 RepID=UPI00362D65B0